MVKSIRLGQTPGAEKAMLKFEIVDAIPGRNQAECLNAIAGFGMETLQYMADYRVWSDQIEFLEATASLAANVDVTR